MDFMISQRYTYQASKSIWEIIDQLTKFDHFYPLCLTSVPRGHLESKFERLSLVHMVLVSITFNGGSQFTSTFWTDFQEDLGI